MVVNVNDEVLLIHNPEAGTLGSEVVKLLQSVKVSQSQSKSLGPSAVTVFFWLSKQVVPGFIGRRAFLLQRCSGYLPLFSVGAIKKII